MGGLLRLKLDVLGTSTCTLTFIFMALLHPLPHFLHLLFLLLAGFFPLIQWYTSFKSFLRKGNRKQICSPLMSEKITHLTDIFPEHECLGWKFFPWEFKHTAHCLLVSRAAREQPLISVPRNCVLALETPKSSSLYSFSVYFLCTADIESRAFSLNYTRSLSKNAFKTKVDFELPGLSHSAGSASSAALSCPGKARIFHPPASVSACWDYRAMWHAQRLHFDFAFIFLSVIM